MIASALKYVRKIDADENEVQMIESAIKILPTSGIMRTIIQSDGIIPSSAISFSHLQEQYQEFTKKEKEHQRFENGDWIIRKIQVLSNEYWNLFKPESDTVYHSFMFGTSENPQNHFWKDKHTTITVIKSTDQTEKEKILNDISELIHSPY